MALFKPGFDCLTFLDFCNSENVGFVGFENRKSRQTLALIEHINFGFGVHSMLTREELEQSKINPAVAREAYVQAEKRLNDVLENKKSLEQKASLLFSAYVTISLALFGIGGAIFKEEGGFEPKTWPFFIAGAIFVFGAFMFMTAIKDERYGFLGSPPSMWLKRGTIDGPNNALDAMLAYLAFHHADRIAVSSESNGRKMRAVRAGMAVGVVATISFAASFLALT